MWLVFGNRTKVRPVPGGIERDQACPRCRVVRRFVECDVADQVSVFFVPLIDAVTRRLVCTTCGEDLEVPASARPPSSASSPPPPPPRAASAADVDAKLAALKKKMGQ